jgi:ABC-type nitrate/sulfonate/bicarbonate transport system permease component
MASHLPTSDLTKGGPHPERDEGKPLARREGRGSAARVVSAVVPPMVAVGVLVAAWQFASVFTSPILISSPVAVFKDLGTMLGEGAVQDSLLVTLREMYLGFAIAVPLGIVIGVLMGRYVAVSDVLSPLVGFFNSTPLVILIPLMVIWVGIDSNARIFFIIALVLWPVLINTAHGMRNVGKNYPELGLACGLSEQQLLRRILLPASLPYMVAGIRQGLSMMVIGAVVGEIEISNVGVGYLLAQYGASYQTGYLLALILITSLIGTANVLLFRGVVVRFLPWVMYVA